MLGWVVLGVTILVVSSTIYMDWNLGRLEKQHFTNQEKSG